MQHAGLQYGQGAATHQSSAFPDLSAGTSSLRQFRKKDLMEQTGQGNQLAKINESNDNIARVRPHSHYPPTNDYYRGYHPQYSNEYGYPTKETSASIKYSEISDSPAPPLSHHHDKLDKQPYHQPYLDPTPHYKSESHPPTHHQYQQWLTAAAAAAQPSPTPKYAQYQQKYPPPPPNSQTDNDLLAKLSRLAPHMARSIMSDHQIPQQQYHHHPPPPPQPPQPYHQQRYYPHQSYPNQYYATNYAACNYTQRHHQTQRYHPQPEAEPPRRPFDPPPPTYHKSYQAPEYAQHYQHRRAAPAPPPAPQSDYYQPYQPQAQQATTERNSAPGGGLRHFLENWAEEEVGGTHQANDSGAITTTSPPPPPPPPPPTTTSELYVINSDELLLGEPVIIKNGVIDEPIIQHTIKSDCMLAELEAKNVNAVSVIKDMPLIASEEVQLRIEEEVEGGEVEGEEGEGVKRGRIFSVDDIMSIGGGVTSTPIVDGGDVEKAVVKQKVEEEEEEEEEEEVQYQNALCIEENSVILEIGGAVVQLNLNQVNGVKVLSVLPLSDSLIIDVNGNYESCMEIRKEEVVLKNSKLSEVEVCEDEENVQIQKNEIKLNANENDCKIISEETQKVLEEKTEVKEEKENTEINSLDENDEVVLEDVLDADQVTLDCCEETIENQVPNDKEVPSMDEEIVEDNNTIKVNQIVEQFGDDLDSLENRLDDDVEEIVNEVAVDLSESNIQASEVKNEENFEEEVEAIDKVRDVSEEEIKELKSEENIEEVFEEPTTEVIAERTEVTEETFENNDKVDEVVEEPVFENVKDVCINNIVDEKKQDEESSVPIKLKEDLVKVEEKKPKLYKQAEEKKVKISDSLTKSNLKKPHKRVRIVNSERLAEVEVNTLAKLAKTSTVLKYEEIHSNQTIEQVQSQKLELKKTSKPDQKSSKKRYETAEKLAQRTRDKPHVQLNCSNRKLDDDESNVKTSKRGDSVDSIKTSRKLKVSSDDDELIVKTLKRCDSVDSFKISRKPKVLSDDDESNVKALKRRDSVDSSKLSRKPKTPSDKSVKLVNDTPSIKLNNSTTLIDTKLGNISSTNDSISKTKLTADINKTSTSAKVPPSKPSPTSTSQTLDTLTINVPIVAYAQKSAILSTKAAKKLYETDTCQPPSTKKSKLEEAVIKIKTLKEKTAKALANHHHSSPKRVTFDLTSITSRHNENGGRRLSWEEYNIRKRRKSLEEARHLLSPVKPKIADNTVTSSNDDILVEVEQKIATEMESRPLPPAPTTAHHLKISSPTATTTTNRTLTTTDWEEEPDDITPIAADKCQVTPTFALKTPIIDVNDFNVPNLQHVTTTYTQPLPPRQADLETFRCFVDSKLDSLNIRIPSAVRPKQQQPIVDRVSLIERFLNTSTLDGSELEKVRKIIELKRKLQQEGGEVEAMGGGVGAGGGVKARIKQRKKRRFRNLYSTGSSGEEAGEEVGGGGASGVGDYSVHARESHGVPKLIFKRKCSLLPQPFVRLERSQAAELLAKKRKSY